MASFSKYIPTLLKWEGGWSDNPKDKGGCTQKGITLATFRQFYGSHRTKEDLLNITDEQWEFIMKTYWDRCLADEIRNQSIAELFVDWHINAGINAIKSFQKACKLDADGIVGPKTLAVLNSPAEEIIFSRMQDAREMYYYNIVRANPSQKVFYEGWIRRTRYFKYQPTKQQLL